MAQHDMVLDNADGAAIRGDINAAFLALATNSSGVSEPPVKYPFMWWPDVSNDMMKQRNAANTAWVNVFALSTGLPPLLGSGTVLGGIAAGATELLVRNKLINGCFRTNQRNYVSGTALPLGVPLTGVGYAHDGWRAGTANSAYTFTQTNTHTPITITAGTFVTSAEDCDIDSGTMILAWQGTSQARVGVNGTVPSGAYASSPILISCTPGLQINCEFNVGTLGKVQLETGSVASQVEYPTTEAQIARCQRRLPAYVASNAQTVPPQLGTVVSAGSRHYFSLPIASRVPPTGVLQSSGGHFSITDEVSILVSPVTLIFMSASIYSVYCAASFSVGQTTGRPASCCMNTAGAKLMFTGAEI